MRIRDFSLRYSSIVPTIAHKCWIQQDVAHFLQEIPSSPTCCTYGGFRSHGGTPMAGWFIMTNPIKMDDLGVCLILGNNRICQFQNVVHTSQQVREFSRFQLKNAATTRCKRKIQGPKGFKFSSNLIFLASKYRKYRACERFQLQTAANHISKLQHAAKSNEHCPNLQKHIIKNTNPTKNAPQFYWEQA